MKKIILILFLLIFTLIIANYFLKKHNEIIEKQQKIQNKNKNIENIRLEKEKISQKISEEKITSLKEKYNSRWLIKKGDIYLENEEHLFALRAYLGAIKEDPQNELIMKKIGDTYYKMKKFKSAYKYYDNLSLSNLVEKEKLVRIYINLIPEDIILTWTWKTDFNEIYKKIDSFELNKDDTFFYKTSIKCLYDTLLCQEKFKKYTQNYKWKNINLLNIKKAFNNYKALQIEKQYFKDVQILAAIFKSKIYRVSNTLAENILKEKPLYLPVLKIIAKWNFELWNYKDAKKYLMEHNKIDDTNSNVHYMLWIINMKLREYILSNIYFIKSSNTGNKNKSEISRRLIYNYYLAKDNKRMLLEFKKLIEQIGNVNSIDYNLWIYHSIINWKIEQANKWTNKALWLFPENDTFYWYKWWILKELWEYKKSNIYLQKWYKINSRNPLINLNIWLLEYKKWNTLKAKIYLKNTISIDAEWDFWKLAIKKLKNIFEKQEKIKLDIEENLKNL